MNIPHALSASEQQHRLTLNHHHRTPPTTTHDTLDAQHTTQSNQMQRPNSNNDVVIACEGFLGYNGNYDTFSRRGTTAAGFISHFVPCRKQNTTLDPFYTVATYNLTTTSNHTSNYYCVIANSCILNIIYLLRFVITSAFVT